MGVLKQGLIRRIGDGQSTNVWNDNWIPRNGMLRPVFCKESNAPALAKDFIVSSGASWDEDKLDRFFLPIDADIIRVIPLSTRQQEDFWA